MTTNRIPLLSEQIEDRTQPILLPQDRGYPKASHLFDADDEDNDPVLAIDAALTARRPLLIRGEPGVGKSQLARAAAEGLGRVFLPKVVDARTEARDLCWEFDAVARLAEAQLAGASSERTPEEIRAEIDEARFVTPGPLWWAFDWASAKEKAEHRGFRGPRCPDGWSPDRGSVLLLDEIDKADSAVPNGLLEALGNQAFTPPGGETISAKKGALPPLVILTTNEERALPDAFVRRCFVLQLALPDGDELAEWLVRRGEAQFPRCTKKVLREAADMVAEDRAQVIGMGVAPPGLAEYLDLLRAVTEQRKGSSQQLHLLAKIRRFALDKHPRGRGR